MDQPQQQVLVHISTGVGLGLEIWALVGIGDDWLVVEGYDDGKEGHGHDCAAYSAAGESYADHDDWQW